MSSTRGPLYYTRPGSRRPWAAGPRLTVAVSGAAAAGGAAALCLLLGAAGEDRPSWLSLTLFAVLAAAVGVRSRPWAAPLVALSCWLLFDGFVAHRYGSLGWSGTEAELRRLGLLTAAALAASLPAALPGRRMRALISHLAGRRTR